MTGFGETVVVQEVIPTGPLTPFVAIVVVVVVALVFVAVVETLTHLRLLPDLVHL